MIGLSCQVIADDPHAVLEAADLAGPAWAGTVESKTNVRVSCRDVVLDTGPFARIRCAKWIGL